MSYFDQRGTAKQVYIDTSPWMYRPLAGLGGLGCSRGMGDVVLPGDAGPQSGAPKDFYMPPGTQYIAFDANGVPRAELGDLTAIADLSFSPQTISARRACSNVPAGGAGAYPFGEVIKQWADAGLLVTYQKGGDAACRWFDPHGVVVLGMTPQEFFTLAPGNKAYFFLGDVSSNVLGGTTAMPTKAFWSKYEPIGKVTPGVGDALSKGMGGAMTVVVGVAAAVAVAAAIGLAYHSGTRRTAQRDF